MRVIMAALLLLAAGCKKEKGTGQDPKIPAQLLTQKEWILTAHGFDDNDNGTVDPGENVIQDCQKDNSYVFHVSGIGSISDNVVPCGVPVNDNFEWRLLNNNTQLEIDFERLSVLKLTEDELVLSPDIPGLVVRYILVYRH